MSSAPTVWQLTVQLILEVMKCGKCICVCVHVTMSVRYASFQMPSCIQCVSQAEHNRNTSKCSLVLAKAMTVSRLSGWCRTEKNASGWSADMLKELLLSVSVDDAVGTGKVTEVSSIDGEASAK